MEIAQLFARVGADVGDFNKAMKSIHGDLTNAEGATNKFADVAVAAFKAVVVAAVAVGTAVGAVVASSVTAAADMEQGIADIGAMMALTSEETGKLKDHILDLGLDPNLKVSATDAAAAVMALGTAGLSMTQIMGGASEATVLLANATGLQGGSGFASAANIATDVMAQFNITASEMDSAVDQIAGTTVASKFTIDDYRLAIAQAGGVAGAVGVDFVDFNAIIAATSSSFASGSDAGTSFKTFLQRLVPTTNIAQDWMKSLGLYTKETGSAFFDAAGNMKSAEEVAGLLSTAFMGLSDAEKIEATTKIFGTDAMRTALALADGGTAIITKMKAEIGKVDAEELAAKRMDTLKGSWEIFQGVADTLKIQLGDKFLPIGRAVVEWATDLANKYGPKAIEFFEQIADSIAKFLNDVLGITVTVKKSSSESTNSIKAMGDAFGALGNVVSTAKDGFTKFKGILTGNEEVTRGLTGTFGTLVQGFWKGVEVVKVMYTTVADIISKYVTWKDVLIGLGILLAGPVLGAIGGVIAGLVSFAAPIAAVITAVAAMRFAWEQDFYGIRTFVLSSLQKMSDWFFEESGIWKGTWEETLKYMKWWASVGWKMDVYFPLRSIFYDIQSDIITWSLFTQNKFGEWVQLGKDKFAGWKNDVIQTFTIWKDRAISTFEDFFGPKYKVVADWVARTASQINTWVQHWKDKIQPWYDWVIEKFQGVIDWWDDNIQPWIDTATEVVTGWWGEIEKQWKLFDKWWRDTWTGTVDWVKNLLGIASPSKVFESIGADLMVGLQIGIDGAKQAPLNAMNDLAGQMQTKMEGMVTKVANSAQTIRDQINNMPALPQGYWSTPTTPTTPTAPVVTPPVIAPPMPGNTPVVTHGGVDFGAKLLSNGLNMIASFVDTSGFMSDIAGFASSIKELLTTQGQTLASSSAEAQAIRDLTGGGLDSRRVNDVLNAIQLLIAEMRERGFSNYMNIQMAPDAALAQQTELEALVAFLNSRMNG